MVSHCCTIFTFLLLLLLSRVSRVRLCNPIDGSPPGSPIPGIFQARVLEWGAIAFSEISEWPSPKKSTDNNAGEGVEKREPSCTVCGNVNWYGHYGRQYGDSSKKKLFLKNKTTTWPSNPTARCIPWGNKNWKRHMHPNVHCGLFTIVRTRKQPRCPSTDECIKKLWYIYTVECYSAIKRSEVGSFVKM